MDPDTTQAGVIAEVTAIDPIVPPAIIYHVPDGFICLTYTVTLQPIDGGRHEVRADDFRNADGGPVSAIGRCDGPQLEPTWIGPAAALVRVTLLARTGSEPLDIRLEPA
ncbi:MAG TPA: hypothetical protein VG015_00550 [Candidatus Dormibacteraeota bacterium]|jgi:hypothetical protein|nr:hypothetical protein [Candidatus Dormibacteraeota bacterium]